jgi:hypothetical protein
MNGKPVVWKSLKESIQSGTNMISNYAAKDIQAVKLT